MFTFSISIADRFHNLYQVISQSDARLHDRPSICADIKLPVTAAAPSGIRASQYAAAQADTKEYFSGRGCSLVANAIPRSKIDYRSGTFSCKLGLISIFSYCQQTANAEFRWNRSQHSLLGC